MPREHTLTKGHCDLDLPHFPDATLVHIMDLYTALMGLRDTDEPIVSPAFKEICGKYNAISLELNSRGTVAPNDRPRMPVYDQDAQSEAELLHERDLEVIELHWSQIHVMKVALNFS
ncbi:MAG: hypothetical protein COB46_12445 [Rhodospirillaceae bacterium]|nr:MAG: hypothetical protein COB46_12445 [Rhodospirillaceae bacterium]